MGYVYYGNYATYYEVGRVELLRSLGSSYKLLEDEGVLMPVVKLACHFKKAARYDEELQVETSIINFQPARIEFAYTIRNSTGDVINTGETTLVFVSSETRRPCRAPGWFVRLIHVSENEQ
jgi:acyl-CoA thioester hydrolase